MRMGLSFRSALKMVTRLALEHAGVSILEQRVAASERGRFLVGA